MEENINCPECGSGEFYELADSRMKCRECGRRFTPQPKAFRIDVTLQKKIVNCFWNNISAEECAKTLGLNRKTLQRFYRHLRTAMTKACDLVLWGGAAPPAEPKDIAAEEFFVISREGKEHIIPADWLVCLERDGLPAKVHYKIYAKGDRENSKISSNDIYLKNADDEEPKPASVEAFIKYILSSLENKKTITRKNFYLYLKESEYRHTISDEKAAINFLMGIIN